MSQIKSVLWEYNRATIAQHLEDVTDQLLNINGFSDAWREFKECLTTQGNLVHNAVNPREFVNEHEILFKSVNRENWLSVPQSLTGIGILGTFVGLMFGLWGLDLSDSERLVSTTTQMIDGIWIAFLTSAVGICCSIILRRHGDHVDHKVRQQFNLIVDRIDLLFVRHTPEMYLREMKDLNRRQLERTDDLIQINQSLAVDLAEALVEPLTASFNNAMDENLKPAIEGLKASMDNMADKLAGMNQDALDEMVQRFTTAMEGAAGEQRERLAESLGGAAETISNSAQMMGGILEQLDGARLAFEESAIFNEEAQNSARTQLQEATEFQQSLMTQLQQISEQLKDRYNDLGTQTDRQVAAAGQLSETVDHTTRTVINAQHIAEALAEAMENAESKSRAIREALGQQEQVAATFTSILENMRSTLSSFDERLKRLTEAGTELYEVVNTLSQVNTDAETLLDQSRFAAEVVVKANKETAERMQLVNKSMQEAATTLQHGATINQNLSETIGKQKQIIETFNEAVQNADNIWSTHTDGFKALNNAIQNGLSKFTNEVNKALTSNLEHYDREMAGISSGLNAIMQELTGTVEGFIAKMDEIGDNGGTSTPNIHNERR